MPSDLVPGVPPLATLGFNGFDTSLWNAIWAPKATPKHIVHALNKAVVAASRQPSVGKLLAGSGSTAMFVSSEEFGKLLREDVVKWRKVVEFADVKMD
jgi:tripartite-type tricarboxylate transporter receptor subunit TctC